MQGQAVLLFELARPHPEATPAELAALAQEYVRAGAAGLVVRTDSADTPAGLRDLWSVTHAVKVPVLARDWLLHPLQARRGQGRGGEAAGGSAGAWAARSRGRGLGPAARALLAANTTTQRRHRPRHCVRPSPLTRTLHAAARRQGVGPKLPPP